jgi:hypothetical protein
MNWALRCFDIAGMEIPGPARLFPSRSDAQAAAVSEQGERLEGWWIVPDDVVDAAYFARCHKDAPRGERRRLA